MDLNDRKLLRAYLKLANVGIEKARTGQIGVQHPLFILGLMVGSMPPNLTTQPTTQAELTAVLDYLTKQEMSQ